MMMIMTLSMVMMQIDDTDAEKDKKNITLWASTKITNKHIK